MAKMRKFVTLKVVVEVPPREWTQPQIRDYIKTAVLAQNQAEQNRDPELPDDYGLKVDSVSFLKETKRYA